MQAVFLILMMLASGALVLFAAAFITWGHR